jgi:pimeloyl-ACP methyl ester carboxylesterase
MPMPLYKPPLRARRRTPLAGLILLLLAACSDGGTGPSDSRVVGGVDLDVLFAPPSAQEIAAVSDEWAVRAPTASQVSILVDSTLAVGLLDVRVRIVSHDVDGITHYGAVVNEAALAGPAPILVYSHGGDGGAAVDDLLALFPLVGDLAARLVWVVPSFRAEPLSWDAEVWSSDGPASPWDRDVDDALSLLEVALQVEAAADEERVGVLGFSRGAGVAMLMAVRDPRIDRVVEFFGPTDFFGPFVQDVFEEALLGTPRDLPGLTYLNETFIQPLKRGELTIAQVRPELVRRSAVFYADRLPALQLHHGALDLTVEVSQAESLIEAMDSLGRGEPDFQAYLYPTGTHNPLTLPGSVSRTIDFLSALLP